MLVVISDLHLTDGTRGSTLSTGAFHLFSERLCDLATAASARADGSYRPIERIDLVLLGDVLDVIHSSRWLDFEVRPWDDPQSSAVAEAVTSIAGDIVRRNEGPLSLLRSLAQGHVRLTPANQLGRRATTSETVGIPVRIHYMVGNRDWFFHLPGQVYDRLRRQLVVHLGLANEPEASFPHDPSESGELLQALRRHRLLARHGDVFDPLSFEGQRTVSSLDDLMAIELVGRFGAEVERELAEELPPATLAGLRDLGEVRPLIVARAWLEGLLSRTCPSPALRQRVKQTWDALAESLLDHPFLREGKGWRPTDLVDGLRRALLFRRSPAQTDSIRATTQWLCRLRGVDSPSFSHHALAEEDFRNRRARHVVYGHTHRAEEVPLETSHADGYVLNQTYFNAGSWRRVHLPTQYGPAGQGFVACDALSFLTFFQGDERRGRPYETWTGSLGINPNEPHTALRVDAGELQDALAASAQAPAAVTTAAIRAPHFHTAPSEQRIAAEQTRGSTRSPVS